MIVNNLNHIQPTTLQPSEKYYPTLENTEPNRFGIAPDVIALVKAKPIFDRIVSVYRYNQSRQMSAAGDLSKLSNVLGIETDTDAPLLFTPSCAMSYRVQSGKVIYYPVAYTCLLDFDITTEDNPEIDMLELKRCLCAIPQIAYCGNRYNDDGLWCIVPILSPQCYSDHAEALRRRFVERGVIIDVSDTICHTRIVSSDTDAYFNMQAKELTMLN